MNKTNNKHKFEALKNGNNIFRNKIIINIPDSPSLNSSIQDIFSEKEFHPYSDMLLHDMGSALDDGHVDGNEKSYEWRTPPLWGLGLAPDSQGGKFFLMHDGRAESMEEAILMHGGEAQPMKESFDALNRPQRDQLIKFLKSL